MFQIPEPYWTAIQKTLVSLIVLAITILLNRVIRSVLHRSVDDPSQNQTLRMLLRNTVFFFGGAAILLVWLGVGSDLAVVMGVLGAGIAFASQEVIGSFAGYLNIITGHLFRIGDRVRLGNVVGDVLDISILRTTVMEIGEWVHADQYTGRTVSIANRAVFSDPLFNYTHDWPYLWDEVTLPVTYESNWRRAGEHMVEVAGRYCAECLADARQGLDRLVQRYPLHNSSVEPELYVMMTDNWVELTVRYVVAARHRRATKGTLHRELLTLFEADQSITVASTTIEIVGFPSLDGSFDVVKAGATVRGDPERAGREKPPEGPHT